MATKRMKMDMTKLVMPLSDFSRSMQFTDGVHFLRDEPHFAQLSGVLNILYKQYLLDCGWIMEFDGVDTNDPDFQFGRDVFAFFGAVGVFSPERLDASSCNEKIFKNLVDTLKSYFIQHPLEEGDDDDGLLPGLKYWSSLWGIKVGSDVWFEYVGEKYDGIPYEHAFQVIRDTKFNAKIDKITRAVLRKWSPGNLKKQTFLFTRMGLVFMATVFKIYGKQIFNDVEPKGKEMLECAVVLINRALNDVID